MVLGVEMLWQRLFHFVMTSSLFFAFGLFLSMSHAAVKTPTVLVEKVSTQELSDRLLYPGRVRSQLEALVTAESEGNIKEILKPVGSAVKKGETVLVIQNTDPVYKYAPVRVVAMASGLISQLNVSLMSKVEKGAPLFVITDPTELRIEVEVPAAELEHFKIGLEGKVGSVGPGGAAQESVAKIIGLSPLVDPKTGTATAFMDFKNKDFPKALRPGLIVQIQFEVNKRKSVLIPSSALTYKEGKPHVRVMSEGKAQRIPVEVHAELGGSIELSSGLPEGSQLIVRSSKFLADGETVEVEAEKKN